jgi:hypothetical protein
MLRPTLNFGTLLCRRSRKPPQASPQSPPASAIIAEPETLSIVVNDASCVAPSADASSHEIAPVAAARTVLAISPVMAESRLPELPASGLPPQEALSSQTNQNEGVDTIWYEVANMEEDTWIEGGPCLPPLPAEATARLADRSAELDLLLATMQATQPNPASDGGVHSETDIALAASYPETPILMIDTTSSSSETSTVTTPDSEEDIIISNGAHAHYLPPPAPVPSYPEPQFQFVVPQLMFQANMMPQLAYHPYYAPHPVPPPRYIAAAPAPLPTYSIPEVTFIPSLAIPQPTPPRSNVPPKKRARAFVDESKTPKPKRPKQSAFIEVLPSEPTAHAVSHVDASDKEKMRSMSSRFKINPKIKPLLPDPTPLPNTPIVVDDLPTPNSIDYDD